MSTLWKHIRLVYHRVVALRQIHLSNSREFFVINFQTILGQNITKIANFFNSNFQLICVQLDVSFMSTCQYFLQVLVMYSPCLTEYKYIVNDCCDTSHAFKSLVHFALKNILRAIETKRDSQIAIASKWCVKCGQI